MNDTYDDIEIMVPPEGGYVVTVFPNHKPIVAFSEMPQLLEWLARNLTARQSVQKLSHAGKEPKWQATRTDGSAAAAPIP